MTVKMSPERGNFEQEGPFSLLIVDDERLVLNELVETLEHSNLVIRTAENAVEALVMIDRDGPPDILLTDIVMPEMGGLDFVSVMRASLPEGHNCATIFASGNAIVSDVATALRLDAVDYIEKPMSRMRVREAIDNARKNLLLHREKESRQMRLLAEMQTIRDRANEFIEDLSTPGLIIHTSFQVIKKDANAPGNDASAEFYSDYLASIRQMESARNNIVGSVASDPDTWSMLTELMSMHIKGEALTVTSLCCVTNCPQTSALRKIEQLEMAGLVERRLDDGDRRRRIIALTPMGLERISRYLTSISHYLR